MIMSSIQIDQDLIVICKIIKKLFKMLKNAFSNIISYFRLSNGFVRGYQRKGTAQFYLGKVDDAILTYKEGLKLDPNNAALLNDLKAA
jgi:tetratricopeptide (TPR) repeat protein